MAKEEETYDLYPIEDVRQIPRRAYCSWFVSPEIKSTCTRCTPPHPDTAETAAIRIKVALRKIGCECEISCDPSGYYRVDIFHSPSSEDGRLFAQRVVRAAGLRPGANLTRGEVAFVAKELS